MLAEARAADDLEVQVLALNALARLTIDDGDPAASRELLRAADDVQVAVGHFVDELERVDARTARAHLGSAGGGGSPRS